MQLMLKTNAQKFCRKKVRKRVWMFNRLIILEKSNVDITGCLLSAEELHAEQREDDDEQEDEQQQRNDGLDAVEKRQYQIAQRIPVSAHHHHAT